MELLFKITVTIRESADKNSARQIGGLELYIFIQLKQTMCSSVTTGYYIVMLFPKLKCVYLCGSCDFCCLYYIIHVLLLVTIPDQFCDVSNNIENVELSASSLSPPPTGQIGVLKF